MERYKISVMYENHSFEEMMEIRAEGPQEASVMCEEFKENNHRMIERMGRLNVFFSKKVRDVRIIHQVR